MTSAQRPRSAKKHFVSLQSLRIASGMKQAAVCELVTDHLRQAEPEARAFTPGSLSLIESGARGASQIVLDAIAAAYGLPAGSIRSDYEPQDRQIRLQAVGG